MNNAIRPDTFDFEELQGLFGPVLILKREDNDYSQTPLPKLLISNKLPSDKSIKTIWSSEIDKWTNHGDVGFVDARGKIRITLCKSANANTLLVTERCDNLCLFCSQPPREVNDQILFAYAAQSLISFNSQDVIGISGGEPLINKQAILNFFKVLNQFDNKTPLHILSNGRAFKDSDFTNLFKSAASGRSVEVGIPLYSTTSRIHDYLVNSQGAWKETIAGLINAGNKGILIELRIIPTSFNYHEISAIVEMALTCFNFISRISIMNLEQTGWAKKNWNELYIKPEQYGAELVSACSLSKRYGCEVALFNYPLCHIPNSVHKHARKSISDWKNTYPKECNYCTLKHECGGFFTSIKEMEVKPKGRII